MVKKNKMSSILFKNISLFLLIISASLFSTSFAGRVRKSVVSKAVSTSNYEEGGERSVIHERILKVRTNDYGQYDPSPAFVKPPFKLIPN